MRNETQKLLHALPRGEFFRKAWDENTNMHKFIGAIGVGFENFENFKARYLKLSNYKDDDEVFRFLMYFLNIPDDVFYYIDDKYQNYLDIICKLNYMRAFNYDTINNIAELYDNPIIVVDNSDPFNLVLDIGEIPTTNYGYDEFTIDLAMTFVPKIIPDVIPKIQRIIEKIKPIYLNITYV